MSERFPARYRRLLAAFSPAWRRVYGELTLSALLELHAAEGRDGPSAGERLDFLLGGLRSRLPGTSFGTPAPRPARDARSKPGELVLLRGGFLLLGGLGAGGLTAAFPADPGPDLAELLRGRRVCGARLMIELLLLGVVVLIVVTSGGGLVPLCVGLVALTAAAFDAVLFVRLGRRILAEP